MDRLKCRLSFVCGYQNRTFHDSCSQECRYRLLAQSNSGGISSQSFTRSKISGYFIMSKTLLPTVPYVHYQTTRLLPVMKLLPLLSTNIVVPSGSSPGVDYGEKFPCLGGLESLYNTWGETPGDAPFLS